MLPTLHKDKSARLFIVLGAFFVTNAIIAEIIGVKIFSLEKTLGFTPFSLHILGQEGLSFNLTTGVLLWPFVFILTDIINEYYGERGVRFLSYLTAILISYAFLMFFIGIHLVPADFWVGSQSTKGIVDMNAAFAAIFGQGLWIIIGSLTAFLIGQVIDVVVFHRIKKATGEHKIWLRATGSTLISQFIDSFVVLFIAFYIGAGWKLSLVLAIGIVNYIYKLSLALLLTPLLYLLHELIERYLGERLATEMKQAAMKN